MSHLANAGDWTSRTSLCPSKGLGKSLSSGVSAREKVGSLVWVVAHEHKNILSSHGQCVSVLTNVPACLLMRHHFLMATFIAVLFFLSFYTGSFRGIFFACGLFAVLQCIGITPSVCFPLEVPPNQLVGFPLDCKQFLLLLLLCLETWKAGVIIIGVKLLGIIKRSTATGARDNSSF